MEGACWVIFSILLDISWASTEGDIKENLPLQSLSCHNDFTTRIICQWEEVADAQPYLNLTLYRQQYKGHKAKQVSCALGENTSLPTCQFQSCIRTCVIHQDIFVGSQIDLFSFQPDRPLKVHLHINLTQNVQPPTPENLKVMKNGSKGFLLSWEMPQSWNQNLQSSLRDLKFKVAYKRPWESWEEASTVDSSMSHVPLGHDDLIPDNHYMARVQAMIPGGHSSLWSSEVSWKSQEGDAAQPKNLRCLFDGHTNLKCTWEVRTEIASSVSFGLFYNASPDAKKECSPVHKERILGSPYVQYRCQIHIQDAINPSQYTVTVQSKKEEKPFPSQEHIKPHPPLIKVKTGQNTYHLKWEKHKIDYDIEQTYQVQYRKSSQSWEAAHNETVEILEHMDIPETSLEPDTGYVARVRTKVTSRAYRGSWSEWSKECTWRTERVLPPWLLPLGLVITTVLMLLGAWCCCTFGARLKTNWENKIPNPSKSDLFQDKKHKIWIPGKHSTFRQESPWEKEERQGSVSSLDWLDFEDNRSSVSPLTAVDPQDTCSLSSVPDPYPASITLPDEDLSLSSFQNEPEPNNPMKDLASGLAFNGPYLDLPKSHSLTNISDQMRSCQAKGNKKQPHKSLEYLCLPQGGQSGLVPMATLAEPGRDKEEKETLSCHPSSSEEVEPGTLRDQATPPSGEPRQEKSLHQPNASSKGPQKSGYIAPEDLVLGSENPESLPPLTMPPLPCSAPESSLGLTPEETKGPLSASSPAMLALEGYVEVPPNMASAEAPPENPGPLAPNVMNAQQDETITVVHPDGLLVLQQIGDYCFFPSQSQLVTPGHCPEKMGKPQDIQGKEPPSQSLPQVPAIQLFKAMKHQDYLALPPWDSCRRGQVC